MTQPHKTKKVEEELERVLGRENIPDPAGVMIDLCATKYTYHLPLDKQIMFQSFAELFKQREITRTSVESRIRKKRVKNWFTDLSDINQIQREKILNISNMLSELTDLRMEMRFTWMEALYYNELFLREIAKRFSLRLEDLRKYDLHEVETLLKKETKMSQDMLNRRKQGFAKILKNKEITTLNGEVAIKEFKSEEKNTSKKELTGSVASKGGGTVQGKVIILSYKRSSEHATKIAAMQKGQILISEMTRPNIVLACEKAAAIVTDEGGILCHAAIVSRELGIPCLVGTGEATEIFKDGDLVEVNIEQKTIKIVK